MAFDQYLMSDFLCDGHVFLSKQVALILKLGGWREKCWTLFRINKVDYNVESTEKDTVNNIEIITHRPTANHIVIGKQPH